MSESEAPARVRRIFTATLVIGVPGSGKTSLADSLSVYLWETFKKILLLYSWDGGAIPTMVQKRMQQGLIRFWRARTRSEPGLGIETVVLASKGYWPRTIDPLSGETAPGVELVAPVTTRHALRCPKGHPMQTVSRIDQIVPTFCSQCKLMIGQGDFAVQSTVERTRGFEQVGGVFFDGLTSMTNVVMEHMDLARGQGQIGGEKPAFGGVVQSGGVKMGGNNRADVGFGQSRGQQFVNNSLSIPYLVEGPVFTALAMEATDEGGLPIVGAKLPGRAATDEASAWFGNVCEMGRTVDDRGRSHVTLYLRPFTDAQNRRHLLKTSSSPGGLPDKLVDPPEDAKQPGAVANLGDVFRALDADLATALATPDVAEPPGLASAPSRYGEATETAVATGVASTTTNRAAPPPPTTAVQTTVAVPVAKPRARAAAPPAPLSTGTTAPPPPGMRPPAKAPGA